MRLKLFLSKEKRDKWFDAYVREHHACGACGDFLPIPIHTALVWDEQCDVASDAEPWKGEEDE